MGSHFSRLDGTVHVCLFYSCLCTEDTDGALSLPDLCSHRDSKIFHELYLLVIASRGFSISTALKMSTCMYTLTHTYKQTDTVYACAREHSQHVQCITSQGLTSSLSVQFIVFTKAVDFSLTCAVDRVALIVFPG